MNREVDQIRALRNSYEKGVLEREHLTADPKELFKSWFDAAVDGDIFEANAIQLATADIEGQPTLRTVLLKEVLDEGYVFYTNYQSRKGKELLHNPKAAFLIFWKEMERQIRVEGVVEKLPETHSTDYYHTRPKGSQIGAWASPQSRTIPDRSILDDKVASLQEQYKNDAELPKPPHWGGYLLKPTYFEFWQGRKNRLHDRFEYRLENEEWKINRLAP